MIQNDRELHTKVASAEVFVRAAHGITRPRFLEPNASQEHLDYAAASAAIEAALIRLREAQRYIFQRVPGLAMTVKATVKLEGES